MASSSMIRSFTTTYVNQPALQIFQASEAEMQKPTGATSARVPMFMAGTDQVISTRTVAAGAVSARC